MLQPVLGSGEPEALIVDGRLGCQWLGSLFSGPAAYYLLELLIDLTNRLYHSRRLD